MTQPLPNNRQMAMNEHRQARYQAARRTAAVAGIFCLVVAALLLHQAWFAAKNSPVDSPQVTTLKEQYRKANGDEKAALQQQIRELDKKLRRIELQSQSYMNFGGFLLLGGAIVLFFSLRYARAFKKQLPYPGPMAAQPADPKAPARRAVSAMGGVFVLTVAAIAFATSGRSIAYQAPAEDQRQNPTGKDSQPPKEQAPAYPTDEEIARNWPRFRGPHGLGISASANVPQTWNGAEGKNIVWKTKLDLPGESSPVIWGDKIFLTGATKEQRAVYCYKAGTGKLEWKKAVISRESPDVMEDTGYAACTGATDGRRFYAMFATGDVVCFDFSGKQVWIKALGAPENQYGHATSLAVWKNLLVVQYDQGFSADEEKSKLYALDTKTGKSVWDLRRPVQASWATPIVVETPGGNQLITAAAPWVIAYDPKTGSELWRANCLSGDVAPSPAYGDGIAVVAQEYSNAAGIKTDGEGDVTETKILWKVQDGLPDIVSPFTDGKLALLVSTWGTVTCLDAKSGETVWQHDYGTEFNSSPTLVGENIYLLDKQGVMHIFAFGREFKEVGQAELGEPSTSSPAYVDNRIYIRGKENLYCIGKK